MRLENSVTVYAELSRLLILHMMTLFEHHLIPPDCYKAAAATTAAAISEYLRTKLARMLLLLLQLRCSLKGVLILYAIQVYMCSAAKCATCRHV